jgi:dihydroorotate dehydrogenase
MLATWFYRTLLRPWLFCMDPEEAHELGQKLLPCTAGVNAVARAAIFDERTVNCLPLLQTSLAGRRLGNPLGLAAGFDKTGRLVENLADLGFGFAEIGSVTALPSMGNPKPRLFRLPADAAVINRLGLNGPGAEFVAGRLAGRQTSLPIAVNIAKTNRPGLEGQAAVDDIVTSFRAIKHVKPIYVTINTSCPNTHEGALKETSELEAILKAVQDENIGLPLFLKLSPDLDEQLLARFVAIAAKNRVAGFVCGNTTVSREGLSQPQVVKLIGNGGLSGRPLRDRSLQQVTSIAAIKEPQQEIIACGGIESADDAFAVIAGGATCVQLYTALVYHGPYLILEMLREMALRLHAAGLSLVDLKGRPDLLRRLGM